MNISPYLTFIELFISGQIAALKFESRYLKLFKAEKEH
jgi:hypothetical protein